MNKGFHVGPNSINTIMMMMMMMAFSSLGCPSYHWCYSRLDWKGGPHTGRWKDRSSWCMCHRIGWNHRYSV